ncbi:hypothetical protein CFK37_19410 [Virgibacillus phasianinus]|uniref:Uncharacterized protein n=1 Tax=Virgibacillus phasianinus TaxID=2017483 RepID=A0A220U861_9BACI|nr:hypothetical protein CFK37_19410 [Virgibacillus phasianinus]
MTHINNIIDIDNKKLGVWIQGEGTPIIIQPGMVGSIMEWEDLATELNFQEVNNELFSIAKN